MRKLRSDRVSIDSIHVSVLMIARDRAVSLHVGVEATSVASLIRVFGWLVLHSAQDRYLR